MQKVNPTVEKLLVMDSSELKRLESSLLTIRELRLQKEQSTPNQEIILDDKLNQKLQKAATLAATLVKKRNTFPPQNSHEPQTTNSAKKRTRFFSENNRKQSKITGGNTVGSRYSTGDSRILSGKITDL